MMQRARSWYSPIITTLTFLIVAGLAAYFLASFIGWRMSGPDGPPLTVEVSSLTPFETVVATGIGADVVTVTLRPGIWVGELDINTEDYDGVKLESADNGRHSTMWWNGARDVIVVGNDVQAQIYPGDVQVKTNAVPGYKWTVRFTRHDVR